MHSRFLLFVALPSLFVSRSALAQTQGTPTPQTAPLQSFDPAFIAPNDVTLRTPVTFEARRMSLPEFVRHLSEAAHITLSLPGELNGRQITAHLESQPVGETMRSLGRLYGLEWQPVTDGYRAQVTATKLEQGVLRAGDLREWQTRAGGREELETMATQVLTTAPRASLESEEGVPLTQIPGLQEQLRHSRELDSALSLLRSWEMKSPFLLRTTLVHVQTPRIIRKGASTLAPRFVVMDASGQTLADLGAMILPGSPSTPTP